MENLSHMTSFSADVNDVYAHTGYSVLKESVGSHVNGNGTYLVIKLDFSLSVIILKCSISIITIRITIINLYIVAHAVKEFVEH